MDEWLKAITRYGSRIPWGLLALWAVWFWLSLHAADHIEESYDAVCGDRPDCPDISTDLVIIALTMTAALVVVPAFIEMLRDRRRRKKAGG